MKTKRIITATLLSAGLILGTTSTAHAVEPVPSANLTVASYSSQIATYNAMSASFDAATVAFRTQISTYAAALAAYKATDAALQLSYQAALKTNVPVTTALRYTNLMSAFNTATIAYNNSEALFMTQSNAYQAAVQNYEKSYQAAVTGFKVTAAMFGELNTRIYMAFETSLHNANHTFAVALMASKTKAQKARAHKVRNAAVLAAIATRSAARVALGAKPISPVQQIKIGQSVDIFAAVRPVRPVMVA